MAGAVAQQHQRLEWKERLESHRKVILKICRLSERPYLREPDEASFERAKNELLSRALSIISEALIFSMD